MACCTSSICAAEYTSYKWSDICSGKIAADWYGSEEAKQVADVVLAVQKNNGGWMKNDQLHKLSTSEYQALVNAKYDHSCLDNSATTQEMRFLAKVYQATKVEKYKTAFVKALNMIFAAELKDSKNQVIGGWGQYWPLTEDMYSYQNYITFNDDLELNVLRIMKDIYNNKGDFAEIVDQTTREKCLTTYNRGIECILKCQIDDNGVKAAWCAQHDPVDYLPTEGRPHELPSVSGYESSSLLSFLMDIDKPSQEVQTAITTAVAWLSNHKYMDNKKIEDYTNSNSQADRRIVDAQGSAIWGRFIQLGGEKGKAVYDKFFAKLKERNKKRTTTDKDGYAVTYTEWEMATVSYDASKAYQPIYSIYSNDYPELFYRFLYNYEDTPKKLDEHNVYIATSLTPGNRSSYQYLGSWCAPVISKYTSWKQRIDLMNAAGDATPYTLDAQTNTGTNSSSEYTFNDGFTITNAGSKGYGTGKENTVKYSKDVDYTITIPSGKCVTKIVFAGYNNYAKTPAYIASVGGKTFGTTEYVFPQKEGDTYKYVTNTIDLSTNPAVGNLKFKVVGDQVCLAITVYCADASGVCDTQVTAKPLSNRIYNLNGQRVGKNAKGLIIENGVKMLRK